MKRNDTKPADKNGTGKNNLGLSAQDRLQDSSPSTSAPTDLDNQKLDPATRSMALSAYLDGELTAGANPELLAAFDTDPELTADRAQFLFTGDCLREFVAERSHSLASESIWESIQADVESEAIRRRADQSRSLPADARTTGTDSGLKEALRAFSERRTIGRAFLPVAAAACAVLAVTMVRSRSEDVPQGMAAGSSGLRAVSSQQLASTSLTDTKIPSSDSPGPASNRYGHSGSGEVLVPVSSQPAEPVADVTFVGLGRANTTSGRDREFPGQISGGPFEIVEGDPDELITPRESVAGERRYRNVFTRPVSSNEIHRQAPFFAHAAPWDERSRTLRVGGADIDWVQGAGHIRIVAPNRRTKPPVIWIGKMASAAGASDSSVASSAVPSSTVSSSSFVSPILERSVDHQRDPNG